MSTPSPIAESHGVARGAAEPGNGPLGPAPIGVWSGGVALPTERNARDAWLADRQALASLDRPVFAVDAAGTGAGHRKTVLRNDGEAQLSAGKAFDLGSAGESGYPLLGYAPSLPPQQLGDPSFCASHGLQYAYMTGAMANGIASADLVITIAKAGCLGSYGAAGQRIEVIAEALDQIERELPPGSPYCCNLIHSPNEPAHEAAVVELFLRRGVRLVEASAYLDLTLPAVRYRVAGIHQDGDGRIVTPNRIVAKASRIEVATRWLSPPPKRFLDELVSRGEITAEQASLAARIPMAEDITAEADSGGHTDNRPFIALLPTFLALRDRLANEFSYDRPLRVGAAGGIATPASAAAAFAMGAAFIVTGTINQSCVESGSSDTVRKMLAQAEQADVIMAPAADMFEMGVKLQVLKRGTMFAMRAQKLYELYRAHASIEAIPAKERASIEKTIFRMPLEAVWQKTAAYFGAYDPAQIQKAEADPRHRMALTFRWYLGLSSRWANSGEQGREVDYQVWCGPAMGAFNEWVKGSTLEAPENRKAAVVAMTLLRGAAYTARVDMLAKQGVRLLAEVTAAKPDVVAASE